MRRANAEAPASIIKGCEAGQTITLDRRALLKGAALLGMSSFCPSSAFAATSDITDVIMGANFATSRFDPYLTTDWIDQIVFFNLFDFPIRIRPDSSLAPGLVVKWETADPTTWVLTLRSGVKWHNGDVFTADDIAFSLARVTDPATRSLFVGSFSVIASTKVRDPLTLEIKTKQPDPFMPQRLANHGSNVLPKKYLEAVGEKAFLEKPVGTGPYKFKQFTAGQNVVLERNENYWDPVSFNSVTIRKIPEMSARTSALRTGEVHIINGVSPDAISQITTSTTKPVTTPSGSAFFLPINMHTAPLNNRDIRHALSLAIDREAIIKNLLGGQATALSEPILAGTVGADPSRKPLAYDPDQARSLLKKAGYAKQEILYETMANAYFGNDREIGEALVAMWGDVGFNAKLSVIEPAVRAQKNTARGFQGLFAAYFSAQYGDAAGLMWRAIGPSGVLSHYWNVPDANARSEFNELGAKAVQNFNPAERAALYQKMSSIMLDVMPWVLMFEPSMIYGASNKLKLTPGPNFLLDLRKDALMQAEPAK